MRICLSGMQRRMRITMMVPVLPCAIAAVFLISASVVDFTYYLYPVSAYSQTEPFHLNHLYKSVVISNSIEQQIQQPQSKVIEASGHFANNQIENDSVSWIQGGLWHLAVYNSSSSPSSPPSNSSTGAKATFSGNFTMVKPDGSQTHEHSVNNFTSNNVMIAGTYNIANAQGSQQKNVDHNKGM
jgi:hypothetical protein